MSEGKQIQRELQYLEVKLLIQQSKVSKHMAFFRRLVRENRIILDVGLVVCLSGIVVLTYKKFKTLRLLPGLIMCFNTIQRLR